MKTATTITEMAQEKMNILGKLGFSYEESIEIVKEAVRGGIENVRNNSLRIA